MIKNSKIQKGEISSREGNIQKSKNISASFNTNNNSRVNQANLKFSITRKINSNNSYMTKFWKVNHDKETIVTKSKSINSNKTKVYSNNHYYNSSEFRNQTINHIIPEEFERNEDASIKTDYNIKLANNSSFLPEIIHDSSDLYRIKPGFDLNIIGGSNLKFVIDRYEKNRLRSVENKSNNSVGSI